MGSSNNKQAEEEYDPHKVWKTITWKEVSKHDSKSSCWIVIGSNVYDVSKF